jgi:4,5-DOPA dioxygenase extradiol
MNPAPSLFVSHGAPTFALEPGLLGPKLAQLGAQWPKVSGIAVVSAHWQTRGVEVMHTAAPETIHDFGGFPPALYRLGYPAPGAPALAAEAKALLDGAGVAATLDKKRGLDHGAWVPLMHLYPKAQIPVFQVSLPFSFDAQRTFALGRALAPHRKRGVLVMGSGSLTHNLAEIGEPDPSRSRYALEFTAWIRAHVRSRDVDALLDYRRLAPHAKRAHPTEEHFLPLLAAVGASEEGDVVDVVDGGMTYGVLSMESYAFQAAA